MGSHTSITLLEKGYNVLIIDNFSNTSEVNITGLQKLHAKLNNDTKLIILNVDLRNTQDLELVFANHSISYVIYFAALKAVWESIEKLLLYYDNNFTGLLNLIT